MFGSEETRSNIVAAALEMVDTPVVWRGRSPGSALDCVGIALCAAKTAGIQMSDPPYTKFNMSSVLSEYLDDHMVGQMHPEPGTVVVYYKRNPHRPTHVGLVVSEDEIVHAYTEYSTVVVGALDQSASGMKCYGFFDFPGLF